VGSDPYLPVKGWSRPGTAPRGRRGGVGGVLRHEAAVSAPRPIPVGEKCGHHSRVSSGERLARGKAADTPAHLTRESPRVVSLVVAFCG
jgi:hypothetical protein